MKCEKCSGQVYKHTCAAFACELPPIRCALHIDEQRHAALAEQARDEAKLRHAARAAYSLIDAYYEAYGLDETEQQIRKDLGKVLGMVPDEEEVYWIYDGERRPVIVKARSHDEAEELIRKHSSYDGFPIVVHRVDEYARRQAQGKDFGP